MNRPNRLSDEKLSIRESRRTNGFADGTCVGAIARTDKNLLWSSSRSARGDDAVESHRCGGANYGGFNSVGSLCNARSEEPIRFVCQVGTIEPTLVSHRRGTRSGDGKTSRFVR